MIVLQQFKKVIDSIGDVYTLCYQGLIHLFVFLIFKSKFIDFENTEFKCVDFAESKYKSIDF